MNQNIAKMTLRLLLILSCFLAGCSSMSQSGSLSSASSAAAPLPAASGPQHIALLLPLNGPYAASAAAIRNGFFAAYYYDKDHNPKAPIITVMDTGSGNIQTIYNQAVSNGADIVVGPLLKSQVAVLDKDSHLQVPTLALNTIITNHQPPSNLYKLGLSPTSEAMQAAQKSIREGHHRAIIINQAGAWGQGIADAFAQRFQSMGGQVVDSLAFGPKTNLAKAIAVLLHVDKASLSSKGFKKIQEENIPLNTLRRQDFDMVFLVASPTQARLIKPLLKFYYAGDIPVYATSTIYAGRPSPQVDRDLNGIIFADMPWLLYAPAQLPTNLANIQARVASLWPASYANNPRLYALGIDAYDLVRNLSHLSASPLQGATGTLSLTDKNQFYRQVVWAQIRGGVPVVQ